MQEEKAGGRCCEAQRCGAVIDMNEHLLAGVCRHLPNTAYSLDLREATAHDSLGVGDDHVTARTDP